MQMLLLQLLFTWCFVDLVIFFSSFYLLSVLGTSLVYDVLTVVVDVVVVVVVVVVFCFFSSFLVLVDERQYGVFVYDDG